MSELGIVESFKSNTRDFFTRRSEYDRVRALLISWNRNDISPEKQTEELRSVLESEYNYEVLSIAIPTQGPSPEAYLNHKISTLVYDTSSDPNSLILVYYVGHCEEGKDGMARWAAFEEGGPTLPWLIAQQLLFSVTGDVLLILDCCNASLITKGSKETGRFELLAASARGVKTPAPGSRSFTKILTKELKKCAAEGVSADELCSRLREDPKIKETPVFHDFARQSPSRIRLKRLEPPQGGAFVKKPSTHLFIRAALEGDVTGLAIANWLKAGPPRGATAVSIEAVVLQARRLQGCVDDSSCFPAGSVFENLSPSAKKEIFRCLRGLNTVMEAAESDARDPTNTADPEAAEETLKSIQDGVSTVCTAVETHVLLGLSPGDAATASGSNLVAATGAGAAIHLQNEISMSEIWACGDEDSPRGRQISRDKIDLTIRQDERFIFGTFEGRSVVIETYKYDPLKDDGLPPPGTIDQLNNITHLLRHPKRTEFRTLSCEGFFDDRHRHELGLVFALPPACDLSAGGCTTLLQLLQRNRIVPLGHRVTLAWMLATAVDNFHRVGWVHKGIRSNNIVFTSRSTEPLIVLADGGGSGDGDGDGDGGDDNCGGDGFDRSLPHSSCLVAPFDLAQPFLFGFEYTRRDDVATNMEQDYSVENNYYRHPDRWGKPSARFDKVHDVYSLGIVLLEIAFWAKATKVKKPPSGRLEPAKLREDLKEECRKKLPHQVGEIFTDCILACLDFDLRTKKMDRQGRQRYFQAHVVNKIGKSVGRI